MTWRFKIYCNHAFASVTFRSAGNGGNLLVQAKGTLRTEEGAQLLGSVASPKPFEIYAISVIRPSSSVRRAMPIESERRRETCKVRWRSMRRHQDAISY